MLTSPTVVSRLISSSVPRRTLVQAAITGLAGVGLAGVGASRLASGGPAAAAADYPTVTITAKDFSFDLPATLPGGMVRLTVVNEGEHTHQVLLIQLGAATTPDAIAAAIANPDYTDLLALGTCYGGPNAAEPGNAASAIVDLPAGDYLTVCLVSDADTELHYMLGMTAPVTVTAPPAALAAPVADLTIDLVEFHFEHLSAELPAGPQVWEITNSGSVPHELVLFQQAPGVSFAMITELFGLTPATPAAGATPMAPAGPPFLGVGGVTPMSPGVTNWAELDLAAGGYFAICFIPSVDHGGGATLRARDAHANRRPLIGARRCQRRRETGSSGLPRS